MISLDAALAAYGELQPLGTETVDLQAALGRTLAAAVHSPVDLPLADQSALDGYALRAADAAGASESRPITLPLSGNIAAGDPAERRIPAGSACRIFTGAWLPRSLDCMVAQEQVSATKTTVTLKSAPQPGQNIRRRGEELSAGTEIVGALSEVTAGLIGALAMCGITHLSCYRQPRIALLVTGQELRPPGTVLGAGAAYDCNGPMLAALLQDWGLSLSAIYYPGDDLAETTRNLREAARSCDLTITTGGVSVGAHDHVKAAAEAVGYQTHYWRVAQKPGKPLYLGQSDTKLLLGLPGNPAAVFVCAHVHLREIIRKLQGATTPRAWLTGRLLQELHPDRQRLRLVRVTAKFGSHGKIQLDSPKNQASHMLSNLALANGIARIPPSEEAIPEGSAVQWLPTANQFSLATN